MSSDSGFLGSDLEFKNSTEDLFADDSIDAIYDDYTRYYFNVEIFRHQIKEFTLGYIDSHNRDCDDVLLHDFQVDLYADAAVSTIKHKFGPNIVGTRKTKIEASDLHINYGNHYCSSDPLLLEKAGESYDRQIGHIAKIVAKNLKKCKHVKGGWKKFKFHHYINIDRGTQANAKHIRNVLLFKLKNILFANLSKQEAQSQTTFTNKHGITFNFAEYFIYLGQELYHLVIRCTKAHIWNYHHGDCWYVLRAFQALSKAYQLDYDIQHTPDVLTEFKGHPYQVFESEPKISDPENFKLFQQVIFAYCRKQGLKVTNIKHGKYIANLELILSSQLLYDPDDYLFAQGTTGKVLSWCYEHLSPRSIARFESVFFVGIKRWKAISIKDYYYLSLEDKQNCHIKPIEVSVPFYSVTKPLHEILLRLASSWRTKVHKIEDVPWITVPMPSYIGTVAPWESIFQIYQHNKTSIHSHPLLRHSNKKLYNDKCGGINRSRKAYDLRDLPWTLKWIKCVVITSKCGEYAPKEIGQHAGNAVEFYHSLSKRNFRFLQYTQTHLPFIPTAQVKIIFSNMIKNTRKLLKKMRANPDNFDEYQKNQIAQLYKIHKQYVSLRKLKKKLDCFGHAWCRFEEIDRTEKKWLHDFDYTQCIKKISALFSEDYSHLFFIIYNSSETKFGEFDHPDFIIKNDSILTYLQTSLGYRMSKKEIVEIVVHEWFSDNIDGLDSDYYDDENNVESHLEIGKSLKNSEYVIC